VMERLIAFLRDLRVRAYQAPPSSYKKGYLDALREVEEYVLDELWEEGEDGE
jgi:hypothetical protein